MWHRFVPLALFVASSCAFTSTGTQRWAKHSTFQDDILSPRRHSDSNVRTVVYYTDEAAPPDIDFSLGQRLRPEPNSNVLDVVADDEAAASFVDFHSDDVTQSVHGRHFEDSRWRGSRTYFICALTSLTMALFLGYSGSVLASGSSELTKFILTMGCAGLVFDNLVNASGRYLGEGNLLRHLCKARTILHGLTVPLLYLPVVEIAMKSELVSAKVSWAIMTAFVAFGLYEGIGWMSFDINDMILVDNRGSKENTPRAMAGTLWYSSGKILRNVIPIATLQFVMLGVGSVLLSHGAPGGGWMFASGAFTLLSFGLQRPGIQAFGEITMIGLLWQAAGTVKKGLL